MREGMKIIIPSVAQGHRCQCRQEGRKDRKERVEFVICKFHPLSRAGTRTSTPPPAPPLSHFCSLSRVTNQHTTYRRPREDYFRKVPGIGEGPRRDSGPLRCNHHPFCGFLACVRKCLRGILRYCHRIFSRNPLRSCLGPWTHTRVTFIPFFVSRPLNRTPPLFPHHRFVDEVFLAGAHGGGGRRRHRRLLLVFRPVERTRETIRWRGIWPIRGNACKRWRYFYRNSVGAL